MLPHRFDAWSLLTHLSPKTIECCHEFVAIYISTTDIYSICINFHLCRFYSQMVNQYFEVSYFLTSFCCSLLWLHLFFSIIWWLLFSDWFFDSYIEVYELDPACFFICSSISMVSMFKENRNKIRIINWCWYVFIGRKRN